MQATPTAVKRKARVHLRGPCVIIDALTLRGPLLPPPSLHSSGRSVSTSASQEDELEADEVRQKKAQPSLCPSLALKQRLGINLPFPLTGQVGRERDAS